MQRGLPVPGGSGDRRRATATRTSEPSRPTASSWSVRAGRGASFRRTSRPPSPSAAPVLLLSGEADPVTPPENGELTRVAARRESTSPRRGRAGAHRHPSRLHLEPRVRLHRFGMIRGTRHGLRLQIDSTSAVLPRLHRARHRDRARRSRKILRCRGRAPGRELPRREREDHRASRSERRGQDDGAPHRLHRPAAGPRDARVDGFDTSIRLARCRSESESFPTPMGSIRV